MGDPDNMAIARTYFAQAIKLNPNSVRSLYGCFLVSTCEHRISTVYPFMIQISIKA